MIIYGGSGTLESIKKCNDFGVKGILTNPQGFQQYYSGKTLQEITKEILSVTSVPIFIQIQGETTEDLIKKAKELHRLSPRVGFKIIANKKGFYAIKELQAQGINCIATSLFNISQASIAANVKAYGICPYVSRARMNGLDVYKTLTAIKRGYKELENPPEIIAVSFKDISDIELALTAGVDAVGMRWETIEAMMNHPLSDQAEFLFGENLKAVKGEDISYLLKGCHSHVWSN